MEINKSEQKTNDVISQICEMEKLAEDILSSKSQVRAVIGSVDS